MPITTIPRFGFGTPEPFVESHRPDGPPSQLRRLDIMPDGKRFVGVWPEDLGDKSQDSERRLVMIPNWLEELKRLVPTN